MSPTKVAILAVLQGEAVLTATAIRDRVTPGTSVHNIRTQIYQLRERHGGDAGIASEVGVDGGYRLAWLSARAALWVEAHKLGHDDRRAA